MKKHIMWHKYITHFMSKASTRKIRALQQSGTLNPEPEKVQHPLFADSVFFDANDLLQIKYEMLRAVQTEDLPITQASEAFGFSRPTVYEAQAQFAAQGLEGLLPHKRGPKQPHKLRPEVMKWLAEWQAKNPQAPATELAQQIKKRWGITVHPRTIEKALAAEAKRGRRK